MIDEPCHALGRSSASRSSPTLYFLHRYHIAARIKSTHTMPKITARAIFLSLIGALDVGSGSLNTELVPVDVNFLAPTVITGGALCMLEAAADCTHTQTDKKSFGEVAT